LSSLMVIGDLKIEEDN